jgi:hypothetical protein
VDERSLVDFKRKREELELANFELEIEAKRIANRAAETEIELKKRAFEAEIEFKRRATEVEIESKRVANHAEKHQSLVRVNASYRETCRDTDMDERARLIFKDNYLNMAMLHGQAAITNGETIENPNQPVSLSMIAAEMGLKIPNNDLISIGVELKKRYVAKHGREPSKHDQLCSGRMTKVNSYTESDRALIQEVLRWYDARSE